MAAIRSALMTLCRRSCNNRGSSFLASTMAAGRGVEIRHAFFSTMPRTPLLPSLGPAVPRAPLALPPRSVAIRNLEGCRHFSTKGIEITGQKMLLLTKQKTQDILLMLWQRSRGCAKNVTRDKSLAVLTAVGCATYLSVLMMTYQTMRRNAFSSSGNTRISPLRSRVKRKKKKTKTGNRFFMLPPYGTLRF